MTMAWIGIALLSPHWAWAGPANNEDCITVMLSEGCNDDGTAKERCDAKNTGTVVTCFKEKTCKKSCESLDCQRHAKRKVYVSEHTSDVYYNVCVADPDRGTGVINYHWFRDCH